MLMTCVLVGRGGEGQLQEEHSPVKMEAEGRLTLLQTRASLGLPEPGGGKKVSLDITLCASRTMTDYISLVLSHQVRGTLLQQP